MPTTQQDLVEEITSSMYAYTQQQPAMTTLTSPINAAAVSIPFDPIVNVPRGVIEIDDELIYVLTSSTDTNLLSTALWGRGHQGTTAASHSAGSRITVDPMFPRKRINDAINQVIGAVDGQLYSVVSYEFTANAAVSTYALPAGTYSVLDASQQTYGPSLEWRPLARYRVDLTADSSFSGSSITFRQGLAPGRTVKLTLAKSLTQIAPGNLLTDSGLAESARDVVVMGVQIKLLMALDMGRLQSSTVQSAGREQQVPITSASTIAGRLKQQFDMRVADERNQLLTKYPTRISRSN